MYPSMVSFGWFTLEDMYIQHMEFVEANKEENMV